MSETQPHITELSEQIAALLLGNGERLATAESCTGGWIGKVLTDLAGSSQWYEGGVIAYSNHIKENLLGVSADVLNTQGAVSEAVAKAMVEGAARMLRTDHAVAVTGIAGPDGGSEDKPVGLVWIAWLTSVAGGKSAIAARRFQFDGSREAVRHQTVFEALQGLIERLG